MLFSGQRTFFYLPYNYIDWVAKSFSVFIISLFKQVNAYLIHYINEKNMLRWYLLLVFFLSCLSEVWFFSYFPHGNHNSCKNLNLFFELSWISVRIAQNERGEDVPGVDKRLCKSHKFFIFHRSCPLAFSRPFFRNSILLT